MASEYFEIILRLVAALCAGGLIGLERSYHGRPAGFRTHSLVCLASSLLMLVTVYESHWFVQQGAARVAIDPTRMAQGIMTGIGFLGAGVIFKEGLTVRGLTTAASIWITAAIGVLTGIGFYFAAAVGVVLTLGTLAVFRHIEALMRSEHFIHTTVRFARDAVLREEELRELAEKNGFSVSKVNYALVSEGGVFEYQTVLRTLDPQAGRRLAQALAEMPAVLEFRVEPSGD